MESHLFYLAFLTVCVLSICNCTAEDAEDHYGARLRREATLEPPSDSAIQSRPKLRITTIVDEPFFLVVDENNIGNSRYEGYIVDLTGQLANKLSFDYEFSLVKDGQYGSLSRDGNWSGMVGELINGEADMVAAGLTISSLRAAVVDFSHPFMHYGIQVLMKKPPDGLIIENSLFEFLSPFEARVWICIFVAFVVVALVLFLLSRFSPYEWRALSTRNEVTSAEGEYFSCLNSFWFTFSTLTLQGYHNSPRSIATRFLSGFWFFFVIVILFAYISNLGAFLTMTKVVSPSMPQSFDELSRQTKIKYSAITGGSTQAFFRYSQIGVYQRMWSFMESNPTSSVWTTKEGVEKVLESNGKYAFIGEGTTLQHIANKDCDLYVMPGTINLKSFGLAFPKNDSRTDSFSRALLELREDGTLDMLYEKWWRGSGLCRDASIFDSDVGQSTQYASAISLTNLSGAFIILLIGIILSIPLLLCEWVVYKQKSKKRDVPETRTDSEGQSGTASAAV